MPPSEGIAEPQQAFVNLWGNSLVINGAVAQVSRYRHNHHIAEVNEHAEPDSEKLGLQVVGPAPEKGPWGGLQ